MYTLIIILIILASLLMIGIVLIQESKGGGLASGFSSSNQIMGVRKTTDFLEKATWGLAIAMVALSVFSSSFTPKAQKDTPIEIAAPVLPTQQQSAPTPAAPAAPAQETPAQ